jgi:tetratricopeptide (TPR) repeat protein
MQARPSDPYAAYEHAVVLLGAGKADDYRQVCRKMLQRFGDTADGETAHWVAWTCALAPKAAQDYGPILALAEKASRFDPADLQYSDTFASILYRAGRYQEAVKPLTEVERQLAIAGSSSRTSPAYVQFFLAMVHERLGHHNEATEWLKKAVEESEKTNGSAKPIPGQRRLTLQLFRTEAEALLGAKDPKSPPPLKQPHTTSGEGVAEQVLAN